MQHKCVSNVSFIRREKHSGQDMYRRNAFSHHSSFPTLSNPPFHIYEPAPMVALIEKYVLDTKPFMSCSPKADAAQDAIKMQGRRYATLRDEAGNIDVLRSILKNMIADSEK